MASSHIAKITAGGVTGRIAHSVYGRCTTAAETAAKVVNMVDASGTAETWAEADLFHGLTIVVQFQYTNSATSPSLNVNNSGAKPIYRYGTTAPSTNSDMSWIAGSVQAFTYDTTLRSSGCWVLHSYRDNTQYSPQTLGLGFGTTSTALSTATKVVTLADYTLITGGIIFVKFQYPCGYGISLNVNGAGAKPVLFRGNTIGEDIPYPIMAGDIGIFAYDGTSYNLLSVDRASKLYDQPSGEEVMILFPNNTRIHTGAASVSFTTANYVDVTVNIPTDTRFLSTDYKVFFSASSMNSTTQALVPIVELRSKTTSSFVMRVHKNLSSTATGSVYIAWLAIGH